MSHNILNTLRFKGDPTPLEFLSKDQFNLLKSYSSYISFGMGHIIKHFYAKVEGGVSLGALFMTLDNYHVQMTAPFYVKASIGFLFNEKWRGNLFGGYQHYNVHKIRLHSSGQQFWNLSGQPAFSSQHFMMGAEVQYQVKENVSLGGSLAFILPRTHTKSYGILHPDGTSMIENNWAELKTPVTMRLWGWRVLMGIEVTMSLKSKKEVTMKKEEIEKKEFFDPALTPWRRKKVCKRSSSSLRAIAKTELDCFTLVCNVDVRRTA